MCLFEQNFAQKQWYREYLEKYSYFSIDEITNLLPNLVMVSVYFGWMYIILDE